MSTLPRLTVIDKPTNQEIKKCAFGRRCEPDEIRLRLKSNDHKLVRWPGGGISLYDLDTIAELT
jgi:hypothetical protein